MLNQGAYLHAKHNQVYFKIISFDSKEMIIEVRQHKTSDGEYFTEKELSERCRGLFLKVFPDVELKVRITPYKAPKVDVVTPDWLQEVIPKKRVSAKKIRELTGIDKGNISNWISGKKPMSQPVKAMFYFMIQNWK